jgi:hypothetical protein
MDIHKDCFSAIDLPDKTVPPEGDEAIEKMPDAVLRLN